MSDTPSVISSGNEAGIHKKRGPHAITVRAAVPPDADKIHSVVSESMEMYRVLSGIPVGALEASRETVQDIRQAIGTLPVFVAVDSSGGIVGSVRLLLRPVSSLNVDGLPERLFLQPQDTVAYFSRFAVHEDRQGLGIGGLLYRAAEEEVHRMHVTHMLLHTSLQNHIMVAFYKKRGFAIVQEDASRGYPRGLLAKTLK